MSTLDSKPSTPLIHWLVTAKIIYQSKGKPEEGVAEAQINVIYYTESERLNGVDLAKMQQAVNLQFASRIPKELQETIEIVDVVFTAPPGNLGAWLPAEFVGSTPKDVKQRVSEGMELAKQLLN